MSDELNLPEEVAAVAVNPETGTAATRVELTSRQDLPRPTVFTPPQEETGWLNSVGAAFVRESMTANLGKIISDERTSFPVDPEFQLTPALEARRERLGELTDVLSQRELWRLSDANSDEELDYILGRIESETSLLRNADANGFLPYAVGGIASAFLDPVSLLTLGPLTKAYTAWRVGSRVGSAARGALLGVADAGLHEAIGQAAQPGRDTAESILAIGIGTVLGGGIGTAFPGRITGKADATRLPRTIDEINSHPLNPDAEDLGEVIPGDGESMNTLVTAARSGGDASSAAADTTTGAGSRASLGKLFDAVSPLGRAINRSRTAAAQYGQRLLEGTVGENSELANALRVAADAADLDFTFINRLIDTHTVTTANEAGRATAASAERIKRDLMDYLIVRTDQVNRVYDEALNDGSLRYRLKGGAVSRIQFGEEVRRMRLAEGLGQKYTPNADLALDNIGGGEKAFTDAVRKAAAVEDKFYGALQKRMVDMGMINPEDAIERYMPQVYDREAIADAREEFRGLLRERFLRTPDDDWLTENGYGATWADLRKNDPAAAAEAAEEWSVAHKADAERFADEQLEAAEQALKEADSAYTAASRDVTITRRERVRRGLAQARANTRSARARLERERVAKQDVTKVYEDLYAHLAVLREQSNVARSQMVPYVNGRPVVLHSLDENGAAITRAPTASEFSTSKTLPTNPRMVELSEVTWKQAPDQTTLQAYGGQTRRLGELEGAVKQLRERLNAGDRRLRALMDEADRLEAKSLRAQSALDQANAISRSVREALVDARRAKRKARSAVRKAERAVKQATGRKTLPEQVDSVVEALLNHRITPLGILPDDVVGASGRTKTRTIDWGDMILDPRLEKFLKTEVDNVANSFAEDVTPRLALREVFGSEDAVDDIKQVTQRYAEAEQAARAANDTKLADDLLKRRRAFERDAPALRDRLLGVYRLPDDPDSAILWGLDRLRELNFLRSMGKVLLSSVTDVSVGLYNANASFRDYFSSTMRNTRKLLEQMPDDEIRALLVGYENMLHYNRVTRTWDIDKTQLLRSGVGAGRTRAATARVADLMGRGTHVMNKLNGMSWWNKRTRITFGTVAMKNMSKHFNGDFSKLGDRVRQMYLRHGIDASMAERIGRLLDSDSLSVQGIKVPNGAEWVKKDPAAFSAFRRALTGILDESVIVPGLGDLPLVMSAPAGRLFLQFQSFAFASVNRYMRPLVQGGDAFAALSASLGVTLAGMSYVARQALSGNLSVVDQQLEAMTEKGDTSLIYEAVTRSPLLGHLAMPLDVLTRLTSGSVNARLGKEFGVEPLPKTTRMGERRAWMIPFGPSVGTAETTFDAALSMVRLIDGNNSADETDRLYRKLVRLAPFQNLFWLQGSMNALDAPGFRPRLQ